MPHMLGEKQQCTLTPTHICVCELGSGPVGSYQLDAVEGGSPSKPCFPRDPLRSFVPCLFCYIVLPEHVRSSHSPGCGEGYPLVENHFFCPLICLVCPLISFFSTLFLFCVLICPLCPPEGDHSLLHSDWLGGLLPQGEQSILHHISQWSTFFCHQTSCAPHIFILV